MLHMQRIMYVNKDVQNINDQLFGNKVFHFLEVINASYCHHC